MNRFTRNLILAGAVAATTLAPIAQASAEDRFRRGHSRDRIEHRHGHHRNHGSGEAAIAAGILGLAVGALIAGSADPATVDDGYSGYREPQPRRDTRYYIDEPLERPRVIYADEYAVRGAEPWSGEWYRYCERRYRTFNAETGTFRGNDGRDHFCVAG